jgi:hypothetical protein
LTTKPPGFSRAPQASTGARKTTILTALVPLIHLGMVLARADEVIE